MPTQILPTEADFDAFKEAMLKEEFRLISNNEFRNNYLRLGLQAPRKRNGREAGFVFNANNLTVFVWTTFVVAEGEARPEDSGWVLISEQDKAKYFAHPFHRTANFFKKLLAYAKACKERVLNRPICPICQAHMQIVRGHGLKARYWACNRHPVLERKSWDFGLSETSLDFLMGERKLRKNYRDNRRASGKSVGEAILSRKPWHVKNPQNRV